MNYTIKVSLDKIKGAYVYNNMKTSKGIRRVIVIDIEECKSIEENGFGIQLSLDMIAKKDQSKTSHFVKESGNRSMSIEEKRGFEPIGNCFELKPREQTQQQAQPTPNKGDFPAVTTEVDDLPF